MLWHHSVTILPTLNCKYIKQPWFEWKSQLDMNFNMKNMKMIINISTEILKSQKYRCRFSVPVLCIFNCLMIWKFHCYIKFVKTLPESTVFKFLITNWRYTNADLKISLHVHLHVKVPENSRFLIHKIL